MDKTITRIPISSIVFDEDIYPRKGIDPRRVGLFAENIVDSYIADLRAATRLGIELKIFRMNSLGIPQDRIAKRLGLVRTSLHYHLSKMAELPNSTNTDLSQGFTVSQVAEKHNWTEPMVWCHWP